MHRSGSGFGNSGLGDSLQSIDWSSKTLKTFSRNFYKVITQIMLITIVLQEHKSVTDRSDDEVRKFRKDNQMSVKGDNIPRPVTTFDEAGFPKYILETLSQQ
jgi:ATP-dependent RNA helicase DDX5/DBP2